MDVTQQNVTQQPASSPKRMIVFSYNLQYHASQLDNAFSDTDLMFQLCLSYYHVNILNSFKLHKNN